MGRNLPRKRRGADLARLEETKVANVEVVGSDTPKGGDSRVPVEIWDGISLGYKGVKVDEALGLLRIIILR